MIVYNNVLELLSANGWSTYRLVREKVLGNSTIARIRTGGTITTDTVDTICRLCNCTPGDILIYVPEGEEQE